MTDRYFDGVVYGNAIRWRPGDATSERMRARIDLLNAKVIEWRKETRIPTCSRDDRDMLCAKIAGTLTAIGMLRGALK